MKDINNTEIHIGHTLKDLWGESGVVTVEHNRIHWVTPQGKYWLCQDIVDLWRLEVVKEEI